jgi:hypothetical protein
MPALLISSFEVAESATRRSVRQQFTRLLLGLASTSAANTHVALGENLQVPPRTYV